jgi:hypothetical protein
MLVFPIGENRMEEENPHQPTPTLEAESDKSSELLPPETVCILGAETGILNVDGKGSPLGLHSCKPGGVVRVSTDHETREDLYDRMVHGQGTGNHQGEQTALAKYA